MTSIIKSRHLNFRLIAITDRKLLNNSSLEKYAALLCRHSIKAIQLREKDLGARQLLNIAVKLCKITKNSGAELIINDRVDITLISGAGGVHSPSNGMEVEHIKKINSDLITGRSVHSLEEAVMYSPLGYDYLIFGPVFSTPEKKKYGKPLGLERLKEVCWAVDIPVFAVGGIVPEKAEKCINAGAYGVAAIRSLIESRNLGQTLNEFRIAMGGL